VRIVQLTNDNREIQRKYHLDEPVFGPAPEALLEGFKALGDEVEVHVVSCLQQIPRRSPTKLADNIFFHPLHVPKIGWLRSGYQGCIRAVRHKLTEINGDIVHGQGTERDCAMCATYSKSPNVLTIHGNMRLVAKVLRAKPFTYYWFASILERHCLRNTNGVVAISNYTASNVAPFTPKTWLVPNAVHPSFFNLKRQPENPTRILCTANVGIRKNQIGLIRAMDSLAEKTPLRLVFAGAGSHTDAYFEEFLGLIRAREWCEYCGPLDRVALQNEMSRATAAVLPSYEDNCPMVVLEAAAAGIPVAASKVGGVPDLVQDQETGMLFDPHSEPDMARVIGNLLAEEAMRQRLAARAREVSLERFAPRKVAERHLQIYRDVVAESRNRHSP
jgi:glycosyltransferase involved in cell wall biosynthesis